MYIDILEVLAQRGPLKLTHIMYNANVNCSLLKEHLNYLTKQGLVEEKIIGKERIIYAISQLGAKCLSSSKLSKKCFP
jgi:predicted transcriptional regulator